MFRSSTSTAAAAFAIGKKIIQTGFLIFHYFFTRNLSVIKTNIAKKFLKKFFTATSASSNPRDEPPEVEAARNRKESVVSSPATMRVLNVLRLDSFRLLFEIKLIFKNIFRHWVSKHFQDFEQDDGLRAQTIAFLDEITCSPNLLPSEHRAASQLLRLLCREDLDSLKKNLELLLAPTSVRIFVKLIFRNI